VDISVSTPALITSLVDEAVEVGAIINLMDLAQGRMRLIEVTLAAKRARGRQSPHARRTAPARFGARRGRGAQWSTVGALAPMHFLEHDHVILITRADAAQIAHRPSSRDPGASQIQPDLAWIGASGLF